MLDELGRVLSYPKLAPVFKNPGGIMLLIESIAVLVDPMSAISILADEDDNRVLESSLAVECRFNSVG